MSPIFLGVNCAWVWCPRRCSLPQLEQGQPLIHLPQPPPLSHSPSTTPTPSEHIFRPLGNESLVFIEGGHCKRSTELMGEKLFLTKNNQIYDLIQNTFYYYLLIDWHIFNVYILRRKLAQLQCMYYGGPNLMSNCTVFNCIHVYLIIAGCRMFNI